MISAAHLANHFCHPSKTVSRKCRNVKTVAINSRASLQQRVTKYHHTIKKYQVKLVRLTTTQKPPLSFITIRKSLHKKTYKRREEGLYPKQETIIMLMIIHVTHWQLNFKSTEKIRTTKRLSRNNDRPIFPIKNLKSQLNLSTANLTPLNYLKWARLDLQSEKCQPLKERTN